MHTVLLIALIIVVFIATLFSILGNNKTSKNVALGVFGVIICLMYVLIGSEEDDLRKERQKKGCDQYTISIITSKGDTLYEKVR